MFASAILDSIEVSRDFFVSLGAPGLLAVAFLEFFLFPIPPDLVLIPLAAARPELALVFAAVATLGSVSAGVVGYAIGYKGGRPVMESRFSDERIEQAEAYVENHGFATVAFGAFAPIPEGYELISIGAGVFGLNVRSYVVASVLGRGGRYFLEALVAVYLGQAARSLTEVEVYTIVGVAVLVIAVVYLLRDQIAPTPT